MYCRVTSQPICRKLWLQMKSAEERSGRMKTTGTETKKKVNTTKNGRPSISWIEKSDSDETLNEVSCSHFSYGCCPAASSLTRCESWCSASTACHHHQPAQIGVARPPGCSYSIVSAVAAQQRQRLLCRPQTKPTTPGIPVARQQ